MLNYLRWFAADEVPVTTQPLTAEGTLEWCCQTLDRASLVDVLKGRYLSLKGLDDALFIFPAEKALIEKILIPLHQAKVAYVLGHELGCIALAGMVAEMLATLRFQISRFGSGPDAMTPRQQERLFGRSFERLEHSRRIGLLQLLHLIDRSAADEFVELSQLRNKYLHRLSEPHEELAADAKRSFEIAVRLAVKITGLAVEGAKIKLNPELLAYVKARTGDVVTDYKIGGEIA